MATTVTRKRERKLPLHLCKKWGIPLHKTRDLCHIVPKLLPTLTVTLHIHSLLLHLLTYIFLQTGAHGILAHSEFLKLCT